MDTLFPLPKKDRPSTRQRVRAFCAEHGILTHHASFCRPDPWMALLPVEADKGKAIGAIMAESCRLYDESHRVATARGELSAVRELCRLNHIPCDL